MKLASYNLQNLKGRARALNLHTWKDGARVLRAHARLNAILNQPRYRPADKAEIRRLLGALGLAKNDNARFAILRQNRGALLRRRRGGAIETVAAGRADWIGWVDLEKEPVDELATRATTSAESTSAS